MTKLKIEKPIACSTSFGRTSYEWFSRWFDTHVTPINKLLAEGKWCYWDDSSQTTSYKCVHWFKEPVHTHKAFMLNITPIKKETAEDVLRDWYKDQKTWTSTNKKHYEFLERAKAALGEE